MNLITILSQQVTFYVMHIFRMTLQRRSRSNFQLSSRHQLGHCVSTWSTWSNGHKLRSNGLTFVIRWVSEIWPWLKPYLRYEMHRPMIDWQSISISQMARKWSIYWLTRMTSPTWSQSVHTLIQSSIWSHTANVPIGTTYNFPYPVKWNVSHFIRKSQTSGTII